MRFVLTLLGLLLLSGCGKDAGGMKAGLMMTGMQAAQAECFAEGMKKGVATETYNYMATLMNAGASEKDAVNRTRRKYGVEFKAAMEKARAGCVE